MKGMVRAGLINAGRATSLQDEDLARGPPPAHRSAARRLGKVVAALISPSYSDRARFRPPQVPRAQPPP